MRDAEHREQSALFRWARLNERKHPELAVMFAIPNGGHRHLFVAKKLKSEGVKPGVPDICLPVPRGNYPSLWIEMKAGRNKPTGTQITWHTLLSRYGHMVAVCYSWQDAARIISEYLQHG